MIWGDGREDSQRLEWATTMSKWIEAHGTFGVYRTPEGEFYCTDGLCTRESVYLADGFVMDYEIECPKHSGTFDYRTSEAKRLPPCVNLRTYPVRVEDGSVLIEVF